MTRLQDREADYAFLTGKTGTVCFYHGKVLAVKKIGS